MRETVSKMSFVQAKVQEPKPYSAIAAVNCEHSMCALPNTYEGTNFPTSELPMKTSRDSLKAAAVHAVPAISLPPLYKKKILMFFNKYYPGLSAESLAGSLIGCS